MRIKAQDECAQKCGGVMLFLESSVKNRIFHTQICACGPKFAGTGKARMTYEIIP